MTISPPSPFLKRQRELAKKMLPGLALIPSAHFVTKSHDTDFPFRQKSDFKYLLGSDEPSALLVIRKDQNEKVRSLLFLRDNDETAEMWMGKRMGVAKARELLPIDESYPLEDFPSQLVELMKGTQEIYFDLFSQEISQQVFKAMKELQSLHKKRVPCPQKLVSLTPLMGQLRLRKDQSEIESMREAALLTEKAFRGAMSFTKPGLNERDISRLLSFYFTKGKGEGHAYDPIVASGENALVLHYIENNSLLRNGDWLLIDAGSQVGLYASDVTRTFPINGVYSPEQRDLYQIVLESQKAGLEKAKKGGTITQIHNETSKVLIQALIDHKILEGQVDDILEKGEHRPYYPHGTGHWIGLDVHDNCPYYRTSPEGKYEDITFEEGMTFTSEPGLYFKRDDPRVPSYWKGLGIRTEDDILITEKGYENLTKSIPKEIEDIEKACSLDFKEFAKDFFYER